MPSSLFLSNYHEKVCERHSACSGHVSTDQVPSRSWVHWATWSLTEITAETLLNFLKRQHQYSLEGKKKKELTALSKHTTLISLFHLNSAKNLNNSLKHSHTKWNLNHKWKKSLLPKELSPGTAWLIKFTSTYRGCCQETSPDWCSWGPDILTLSLPCPWVFQRRTGQWDLGAHHQAHWLEGNTHCSRTTCRGLGSGQQTRVAGQLPTAGPSPQGPLMGLHTAKWGSTCQQLRNNGMALVHLAELGLLWVTWLPIS